MKGSTPITPIATCLHHPGLDQPDIGGHQLVAVYKSMIPRYDKRGSTLNAGPLGRFHNSSDRSIRRGDGLPDHGGITSRLVLEIIHSNEVHGQ